MKLDSNQPGASEPHSPEDDLADALLSEHARLGSSDDEDLISRILVKTVHRTDTAPISTPTPARVMSTREWMQMGVAVAAVIAVLLLALSMMNFREDRTSETFHMTVKFVDPPVDEMVTDAGASAKAMNTRFRAYDGPVDLRVDNGNAVSSVTIEDQNFNLITHFERSFESLPVKATRSESFTIASDHSHHIGEEIVYEGDVVMKHRDFVLKAVSLRLVAAEATPEHTPAFVAETAEIRHRASGSVAIAAKVVFDTASGSLIAAGVSSFRKADGELSAIDPDMEQLVFNGSDFQIQSGSLEKYANPAPLTPR